LDTTQLAEHLERRRRELRMPKTLAARRSGLSLPTVNRLLSTKERRPTVDSVSALAGALGLEVVLGRHARVRPVASAAAFRERRARTVAVRLVGMVQGSMALEADGVPAHVLRDMERDTVHELLAGSARRLWSD